VWSNENKTHDISNIYNFIIMVGVNMDELFNIGKACFLLSVKRANLISWEKKGWIRKAKKRLSSRHRVYTLKELVKIREFIDKRKTAGHHN